MAGVLVVAETRRGELREVCLELIAAAALIACGRLPAQGRAWSTPTRALRGGSRMRGRRRDHRDRNDRASTSRPTSPARRPSRCSSAERPECFMLGAHDRRAWASRPRSPPRCGLGFATDVTRSARRSGGLVARRGAVRRQGCEAELEFPAKTCMLADGARRAPTRPPRGWVGAAVDERLDLSGRRRAVEHLGFRRRRRRATSTSRPPSSCSRSAAASRTRTKSRSFERLAEQLGATLGVSRPLVDAGWMPSARQVGQSGRRSSRSVYLAFGISGAVQHLAGMQDARHDHRGQHRRRGADLRRGPLRRGRRPVRRRRGVEAAVRLTVLVARCRVDPRRSSGTWRPGCRSLWYALAVASVLVFAYGVARPRAKYRRGQRRCLPPRRESGDAGRGPRVSSRTRTIARRDARAGWAHRGDLLRLPDAVRRDGDSGLRHGCRGPSSAGSFFHGDFYLVYGC